MADPPVIRAFRHRSVAWIALFAILVSALAPAISRAMGPDESGRYFIELCSAEGTNRVALTADEAADLIEAIAARQDRAAFAALFRHFAPRRALPGSTAPALGPAIFFANGPCQLCQVALSGPAFYRLPANEARLRMEAKTNRETDIAAPHTTEFAIMFLPTEGLYAEVLRRPGLVDALLAVTLGKCGVDNPRYATFKRLAV